MNYNMHPQQSSTSNSLQQQALQFHVLILEVADSLAVGLTYVFHKRQMVETNSLSLKKLDSSSVSVFHPNAL